MVQNKFMGNRKDERAKHCMPITPEWCLDWNPPRELQKTQLVVSHWWFTLQWRYTPTAALNLIPLQSPQPQEMILNIVYASVHSVPTLQRIALKNGPEL